MNKILFIDTETGGLNPKEVSLLSIGLVAWENGAIKDSREIFIKQKLFKITPDAIRINKINLYDCLVDAIPEEEAISSIIAFIKKNNLVDETGTVVLAGHNVNFDIGFLKELFVKEQELFEKTFGHRFIDTASILKFLLYAGKLSADISSSTKAFEYFNIMVPKRHSALGDALATANLFTELLNLVQ